MNGVPMNEPATGLEHDRDQESVAILTRNTQLDLERWAEHYPSFAPEQFSGVILTNAVHVPDWSRSQRLVAVLVSAWILMFDGMVDEGRISPSELHARVAGYKAVIRGETVTPPRSDDDLFMALIDIRERMAIFPAFTSLSRHWQWSFDQMVDAIVWQRHGGPALGWVTEPTEITLPSYDALMKRALHSIGVPFYLATCFILHDEPTLEERLPVLIEIGEECARAIRLANDLRTWEREELEQTINTVVVLRYEILRENPEIDPVECRDRAIQILRERELASIARTHTLLASSPGSASPVEAGIGRLLNYVTGFYALQDYRTGSVPS